MIICKTSHQRSAFCNKYKLLTQCKHRIGYKIYKKLNTLPYKSCHFSRQLRFIVKILFQTVLACCRHAFIHYANLVISRAQVHALATESCSKKSSLYFKSGRTIQWNCRPRNRGTCGT